MTGRKEELFWHTLQNLFVGVPVEGESGYINLMRTVDWHPLRESAYRLMNDEFGRDRVVAPRAWFFGTQIGEQAFITLQRADRRFNALAIVGVPPAEVKVTRRQEALIVLNTMLGSVYERVQARGLSGFIAEWFRAYEEHSVGAFITQEVRTAAYEAELGVAYRVECDAWIAPFDMGVSQHVRIDILPTDYVGVYGIQLELTRLSGDIANWKCVNRRFLNILRKQFLIWRALPQEQRDRYLKEEWVGV